VSLTPPVVSFHIESPQWMGECEPWLVASGIVWLVELWWRRRSDFVERESGIWVGHGVIDNGLVWIGHGMM
jgi:hypothetical protein